VHVVLEISLRTDRQTYSSHYFATSPAGEAIILLQATNKQMALKTVRTPYVAEVVTYYNGVMAQSSLVMNIQCYAYC